jgi:hypothetical protein
MSPSASPTELPAEIRHLALAVQNFASNDSEAEFKSAIESYKWKVASFLLCRVPTLAFPGTYTLSPKKFFHMVHHAPPPVLRAYLRSRTDLRADLTAYFEPDSNGNSVFHSALSNSEPVTTLTILRVEFGFPAPKPNHYNNSVFSRAVTFCSVETVKWLDASGFADHNVNQFGETAFHRFCANLSNSLRLSSTAHPNVRTRAIRMLVYLHEAGYTNTERNKYGHMPLHKAVPSCSLKFIRLAHRFGLVTSDANGDDKTSLELAYAAGNLEVARFLQEELGHSGLAPADAKTVADLPAPFKPFSHYPCFFTFAPFRLVTGLDKAATTELLSSLSSLRALLDSGRRLTIAADCEGDRLAQHSESLGLLQFACVCGEGDIDAPAVEQQLSLKDGASLSHCYMVEFPVADSDVVNALRSVFNHPNCTIAFFSLVNDLIALTYAGVLPVKRDCRIIDCQLTQPGSAGILSTKTPSLAAIAARGAFRSELSCPQLRLATDLQASHGSLFCVSQLYLGDLGYDSLADEHEFLLRASSDVTMTAAALGQLIIEGTLKEAAQRTLEVLGELDVLYTALDPLFDMPWLHVALLKQSLYGFKGSAALVSFGAQIRYSRETGVPVIPDRLPDRFTVEASASAFEELVVRHANFVENGQQTLRIADVIGSLFVAADTIKRCAAAPSSAAYASQLVQDLMRWPRYLPAAHEIVTFCDESLQRHPAVADCYARLLSAASSAESQQLFSNGLKLGSLFDSLYAKNPAISVRNLFRTAQDEITSTASYLSLTPAHEPPSYWPADAPLRLPANAEQVALLDAFCKTCGAKQTVEAAELVCNKTLYALYGARRRIVSQQVAACDASFALNSRHSEFASYCGVRDDVNEALLFHGSKPAVLPLILGQGFDPRIGQGYHGHGSYFADDPNKAFQYSALKDAQGRTGLILGRVTLGKIPFVTDGDQNNIERPPDVVRGEQTLPGSSLIALPQPQHGVWRNFREYLVFQRPLAYPEWIIWFQNK